MPDENSKKQSKEKSNSSPKNGIIKIENVPDTKVVNKGKGWKITDKAAGLKRKVSASVNKSKKTDSDWGEGFDDSDIDSEEISKPDKTGKTGNKTALSIIDKAKNQVSSLKNRKSGESSKKSKKENDADTVKSTSMEKSDKIQRRVMTPSEREAALAAKRRALMGQIDPEDGPGTMKQKSYYSDDVFIKMTNLLYDPLTIELCTEADITDVAQLLGLTKINSSREAFYWSHRLCVEAFANRYRPGGTGPYHPDGTRKWSIDKLRMVSFMLARRSLPGTVGGAFALGVGLAQEQSITRSDGEGEADDW